MGLAPKITGQVFDALASLRQGGLSILLIEQNAPLAFELADRGTSCGRARSWSRAASTSSPTTTSSAPPTWAPDELRYGGAALR